MPTVQDRHGCPKGVRDHLATKPYWHTAKTSTCVEWPWFEEDQAEVTRPNTPQVRGMIGKVGYLLEVQPQ